jgi:hypothetical protein
MAVADARGAHENGYGPLWRLNRLRGAESAGDPQSAAFAQPLGAQMFTTKQVPPSISRTAAHEQLQALARPGAYTPAQIAQVRAGASVLIAGPNRRGSRSIANCQQKIGKQATGTEGPHAAAPGHPQFAILVSGFAMFFIERAAEVSRAV